MHLKISMMFYFRGYLFSRSIRLQLSDERFFANLLLALLVTAVSKFSQRLLFRENGSLRKSRKKNHKLKFKKNMHLTAKGETVISMLITSYREGFCSKRHFCG